MSSSGGTFLGRFTVLRGAMRELWLVFLAKLLGIVAYGLVNSTLVLWLSYDLGYNDAWAGYVALGWSTAMTLFTVFVGSFADAIGLRKALLFGVGVCVLSRGLLAFTTLKWLVLVGGLVPLALGEALGVPVLVAGIRRFSTTAQRSISFAIFYAIMNGGFFISNNIFDHVRATLGEPHGSLKLPLLTAPLTTYRVLFLVSFLFELGLFVILFFSFRSGVEATDAGVKLTPEPRKYPGVALFRSLLGMTRDAWWDTVRIFGGLWRQAGFYKFLAFLGFAAFVRLIFIHMYYTYPKFGIRELGEGAPVGRLFGINSIMILFLVPIVGALTQRVPAFKMVKYGSLVAAASVFIMAAPTSWFRPLADGWLGHSLANRWFGGYYRFSPDDFLETRALGGRLRSGTNGLLVWLRGELSPATQALLRREQEPRAAPPAVGPSPSSALFAPADLRSPERLFARLTGDTGPNGIGVANLSAQFSKAGRAAAAEPDSPLRRGDARALAEELNHVLHGKLILTPDQVGGLPVSEAARILSAPPPAGARGLPNQNLLANRLLIEDLYGDLVPPSLHPLRVALADDFTRLITHGSLAGHPDLANLPLSPATRAALAQHPSGGDLIRANRMILEDTFGGAIAFNRLGVVGSVNPYYVMIFLFIVLLSIGESVYSPRLYEYAAAIAPKGQEASYMSLSYLPFFFAKMLATSFSGVLLAAFCPEAGPRHSEILWWIIAFTTLVAPFGLFVFEKFIRVPEAGRSD